MKAHWDGIFFWLKQWCMPTCQQEKAFLMPFTFYRGYESTTYSTYSNIVYWEHTVQMINLDTFLVIRTAVTWTLEYTVMSGRNMKSA